MTRAFLFCGIILLSLLLFAFSQNCNTTSFSSFQLTSLATFGPELRNFQAPSSDIKGVLPDGLGSNFIYGNFYGTYEYIDAQGKAVNFTSANPTLASGFALKQNATNGNIIWFAAFQSSSSTTDTTFDAAVVDQNGDLLIIGKAANNLVMGIYALTGLNSVGDVFLAKLYNANGDVASAPIRLVYGVYPKSVTTAMYDSSNRHLYLVGTVTRNANVISGYGIGNSITVNAVTFALKVLIQTQLSASSYVYGFAHSTSSLYASQSWCTPVAAALDKTAQTLYIVSQYTGYIAAGAALPFTSQPNIVVMKLSTSFNAAWAQRIYSNTDSYVDTPQALALVSNNQKLLVVGGFTGTTLSFQNSAITVANTGSNSGFIARMSASNGAVEWAKSTSGAMVKRSVVSSDDSIILAGEFTSDLRVIEDRGIRASSASDVFVAKVTPDGNLDFIQTYGGSSQDSISALAISGSTIAIAGAFTKQAVFAGQTIVAPGIKSYIASISILLQECSTGYLLNQTLCKCLPCEAGVTCVGECPPGLVFTQGFCTPCAVGYFNPSFNASRCETCPAGTFSQFPGATSFDNCTVCPAGTFSNAAASACTNCTAGSYNPYTNQTSCIPCPSGTYSQLSGAVNESACQSCPAGTYYFENACKPCLAGYFSEAVGAINISTCQSCPVNTYSAAGAANCTACGYGTVAFFTASTKCISCPRGSMYQDGSCVACPSGTYASAAGVCTLCLSGSYNPLSPTCSLMSPFVLQSSNFNSSISTKLPFPLSTSCISKDPQYTCDTWRVGDGYLTSGNNTYSHSIETSLTLSFELTATSSLTIEFTKSTASQDMFQVSSATASTYIYNSPFTYIMSAGYQTVTFKYIKDASISSGLDEIRITKITVADSHPLVCTGVVQSCTACDAGTFLDHAGGKSISECKPCPMGSYQTATGSATCTPCPDFFFSTQEGARNVSACRSCGPGYTADSNHTMCLPCGAGNFSAFAGDASRCYKCPSGSFSDSNTASSCAACASGQGAPLEGSNSCSSCLPGYYSKVAASCTTLDTSLKFNTFSDVPPQFTSTCTKTLNPNDPCAPWTARGPYLSSGDNTVNSYLRATLTIEVQFNTYGTVQYQIKGTSSSEYVAMSIDYSTVHTTFSTNNVFQTKQWSVSPGKRVISWTYYKEFAGTTTADSFQIRSIIITGVTPTYCINNASTCAQCPLNTYSAAPESAECTSCGAGRITRAPGATSEAQCIACPPGYWTDESTGACNACPAGSYSATENAKSSSVCISCEAGYSSAPGSTSCLPCPAGTANFFAGGPCNACSRGFYSNDEGSKFCSSCEPGTYADEIGSKSCKPCEPGKAALGYNAQKCDYCGWGFFATSSSTCGKCPPGTYSQGSPCLPCAPGSAQPVEGSSSCSACTQGSYAPSFGLSSCLPCNNGNFTKATSATTCQQCGPATYSDAAATVNCKPCPPGTFATTYGNARCEACPAGFTNNAQSLGCVSCTPGTYSTGGTACMSCPQGSYSSSSEATACTPCPESKSTPTSGATSEAQCTVCAAGYKTEADLSCTKCPSGYGSNAGDTSCYICPEGQYSESGMPCTLCSPGTNSSIAGSSRCEKCPKGTFAKNAGSQTCQQCSAGTFADQEGASFCQGCPAGSHTGGITCTLCASGHYSPVVNATDDSVCRLCGEGFYSSSGAAICQACPGGTASRVSGAINMDTCKTCAPGTFAPAGSGSCEPCPVNTFSTTEKAAACTPCPQGTVSKPGSLTCALGAASSLALSPVALLLSFALVLIATIIW